MSMERKGIAGSTLAATLWGLLVFRVAGIGPAASPQPKPTAPPASAAAQDTSAPSRSKAKDHTAKTGTGKIEADAETGPWLASQEYFAGAAMWSGQPCPAEERSRPELKKGAGLNRNLAGSSKSNETGKRRWCTRDGEQVAAMIAIVPDPKRSHLALGFDRIIEAIQLAAASMHYVIDRYWLPWNMEPKTTWGDYDSLREATLEQRRRESEPGLLIFRWEGPQGEARPSLLYVFLAGETATAGVNREQFDKAVRYMDDLHASDSDRCGGSSCIHVLGPTTSGSLRSLQQLISAEVEKVREWTDSKSHYGFRVYTGTILTGDGNKKLAGAFEFRQFLNPALNAMQELIYALYKSGNIRCTDSDVAILSEAGTALGESVDKAVQWDLAGCVDIFYYPREIASLRNAYRASTQGPATGDSAARPQLPLDLTDATNNGDEPPDFSKEESPLSKEAALMNFSAEMRRKRYAYIGIVGTNELDVVFLVSFLRRAAPDARLFLMDSDLLMQHEPDNVPYIGTLAVTTYPLFDCEINPSCDIGAGDARRRRPFSTQFEEGEYNAAICLVRKMLQDPNGAPPEARDKFDMGRLSERSGCFREDDPQDAVLNPPLWLTAFGAGGHWPVQVLSTPTPARPEFGAVPVGWRILCALLSVLAGVHILVLLDFFPFSPKFRDFLVGSVAPAARLFAINLASATLASALALVILSGRIVDPCAGIAAFLTLALPAVSIVLVFRHLEWRKAAHFPVLGAIAGIWAMAGGLAYLWWTLLDDATGHYGAFFSYRAVHLGSAVSPLMPMLPLLAAIYLAAIFYAWHLRFDDKVRPRLNANGVAEQGKANGLLEPNRLRPGLRSEKRITEAVNGDSRNLLYGLLIFLVWFGLFWPPKLDLFERRQFLWLYQALFYSIMLLVFVSGIRLALIWERLRQLLLELNRQRVRHVFSQLKGEGWSSIWFYGSEDPDWDYMHRSHETLQQLSGTSERLPGSWEVVAAFQRTRWELQQEIRKSVFAVHKTGLRDLYRKMEDEFYLAQRSLAAVLARALDRLTEIWKEHPPSLEEDEDVEHADRPVVVIMEKRHRPEWRKLLEKYVALRYAAFIRAVIARIRLLIIFLAAAYSLAMLSLVIYSFEPHRELIWSVTALFIVMAFIVVRVLMQMYRDPILSKITGTKPNQLGLEFYVRLAVVGLGPILTLLATHFPSIGQSIASLLQPGLEALK